MTKEIMELWEHIYQAEKEIKEIVIVLENRIREESELSGFVFKGITILNILIEIKNQLKELEKERTLKANKYRRSYIIVERKENKENLDVIVIWDDLIYMELFTEQELKLITEMNGFSVETLNKAIKARYDYENYKSMIDSEYFIL